MKLLIGKILLLIMLVSGWFGLVWAADFATLPTMKLSWETGQGLMAPESVLFDPVARILLVSNVNGSPLAKDGNGFISKVAFNGVVLDDKWLTGLNAPKGMALRGDTLYVADIDELVAINWTNGQRRHYPAPQAKFLNDVAIDGQGRVYVSAMLTNTIYRLAAGKFVPWFSSPDLPGPNGLLVQGDSLYIACWGVMAQGFQTSVKGHIQRLGLADKTLSSVGPGTPLGNLDGLAPDYQGGFWVTDNPAGNLVEVDGEGRVRQTINLGPGCADIVMLPKDWQLLIVPMMGDNSLRGFQVNQHSWTRMASHN